MIDLNRQIELRRAIEQFFFAYRAFTAPPDRILSERGLGRVHHRVLYFVARQPGTTVTELLGTLGVTKQALHAPLRQLLDDGLVMSRPDDEDKRVRRLCLTEEGARLEDELTGTQATMLDEVFARAGGKDAEAAWLKVMQALGRKEGLEIP